MKKLTFDTVFKFMVLGLLFGILLLIWDTRNNTNQSEIGRFQLSNDGSLTIDTKTGQSVITVAK